MHRQMTESTLAQPNLIAFPLIVGTKRPALGWRGVKLGQYPAVGNYGIALSADLLVLDFDVHRSGGQESLDRFFGRYPNLHTRIVQTPRGGFHVYLKKDPQTKYKQKDQPDWPGVDFQSEGQYVVGPGSETLPGPDRAAGEYKLLGNAPIADAPADFLSALELAVEKPVATGAEASLSMSEDFRFECQTAAPAVQGQAGDQTTYQLACRGRDMGLPVDVVYQWMRDEWNPKCQPPWGEGELYTKVKNAYKYAKNAPGNRAPEAIFTPTPVQTLDSSNVDASSVPIPPLAGTGTGEKKETASEQIDKNIHTLFGESASFWKDDCGTAYVTIPVHGHNEHYRVTSRDFRLWMQLSYRKRFGKQLSADRIKPYIDGIEAEARFNGERHKPAVRLAKRDDCIYIDLCNDSWQVVEVSKEGWRLLDDSPVKFVRTQNMRSLPIPVPSQPEVFRELRSLLNLPNDDLWALYLGYVFACLNYDAPNPVLVLNGEQASAKSFHAKVVRWLVDPAGALTCGKLKDEKDLLANAASGHVLALDNLSRLSEDMSNSICRLATEGGNSFRQLYSDGDLFSFDFVKPVVLTGIESFVTKSDLLSRSIVIELPAIPEASRVTEEQLLKSLEAAKPRVLGALLTAISAALRRLPHTNPSPLPRLADMAKWVTAGEVELGLQPGQFLSAYWKNQRDAAGISLEASPVAQYILNMDLAAPWTGTAEALRQAVSAVSTRYADMMAIPKTSKAMGDHLRRLAPDLRKVGIDISFGKRSANLRPVTITRLHQPISWQDVL